MSQMSLAANRVMHLSATCFFVFSMNEYLLMEDDPPSGCHLYSFSKGTSPQAELTNDYSKEFLKTYRTEIDKEKCLSSNIL